MRPRGRFKCKNNALGTYMKIILTTYLLLYSTEKRNFASLRSQTENEKAVFGNIQHGGACPSQKSHVLAENSIASGRLQENANISMKSRERYNGLSGGAEALQPALSRSLQDCRASQGCHQSCYLLGCQRWSLLVEWLAYPRQNQLSAAHRPQQRGEACGEGNRQSL